MNKITEETSYRPLFVLIIGVGEYMRLLGMEVFVRGVGRCGDRCIPGRAVVDREDWW